MVRHQIYSIYLCLQHRKYLVTCLNDSVLMSIGNKGLTSVELSHKSLWIKITVTMMWLHILMTLILYATVQRESTDL